MKAPDDNSRAGAEAALDPVGDAHAGAHADAETGGRGDADPTGDDAGFRAAFPAEAADPHCLLPGEAVRLLRGTPWKRFAVLGDSLAEGLGDPLPGYRTASWADRVAAALAGAVPGLVYLNLGERGLTAAQVRERQADRAAAFAPDLVAMVCGGNDLLLPGFSPEALDEELDLLFSRFAGPRTTVFCYALANVAAAVPELRGGPLEKGVATLNFVTRSVARRHGALVVEMYEHPAVADRDLFSADLVHGSARGHAVFAAAAIRTLAAAQARAARSSAVPRP